MHALIPRSHGTGLRKSAPSPVKHNLASHNSHKTVGYHFHSIRRSAKYHHHHHHNLDFHTFSFILRKAAHPESSSAAADEEHGDDDEDLQLVKAWLDSEPVAAHHPPANPIFADLLLVGFGGFGGLVVLVVWCVGGLVCWWLCWRSSSYSAIFC